MTDTGPEDQDLERLVRAGLEHHAGEVDTAVPVATLARSAARRRRTTRLVAGTGALAVAAALVTAVVVDRSGTDPDGTGMVVDRPSPDPVPVPVPGGWRREFWHDTQVDVPKNWGWGTAPTNSMGGGTMVCGELGASVGADGRKLSEPDPGLPYVGRPIMLSDMCVTDDGASETPTAPYVWLGAAVKPGTVDLGHGWVQETREVNGSTVTVGTDDDQLRKEILDSATGSETCLADLEKPPTVDSRLTEGMGAVRSGRLCVYRDTSGEGGLDLVYARELSADEGEHFAAAANEAPPAAGCRDSLGSEYAVLTLTGDDPNGTDPVAQDYVIDSHCSRVETSPGEFHALTEADVRPWARDGISATMTGPVLPTGDGWVYDYFIGMLG